MKKYLFLAVLFISFFSCKKDDNKETIKPIGEYQYLNSLYAGQETGLGIKYTDIEPDDILTVTTYSNECTKAYIFDNNDSLGFKITYGISSPFMLGAKSCWLKITPLNKNSSISVLNSDTTIVDTLKYNNIIDSTKNWSNSMAILYSNITFFNGNTSSKGFWQNNNKFYIGIRMKNKGKYIYGWIFVKCGDYNSFSENVITRYAITIPYLIYK